jgi:pimeloyl-ACP methyl ester carboxylesterase
MADIKIGDINIAYDDVGSGPAVVLLHGYPFNRSMWSEQVAALRDTHRVVTPDLRGLGESDCSDGPATMNTMAGDVAALMDALEIQRAAVGGLSMGGYVALAFYKLFPLRVRSLLLADTRPQGETEEGKQIRAQQIEKVLAEGMAGIADAMLPKLLHPETVSKRPEVVKRIRDMMLQTKPAGAAAALLGMVAREDQTESLSRIIAPTLILVGRDDAIAPVQDSEKMHQEIGGSRLVVIESAGHVSNIEQPDKFNTELIGFLNQ